MKAKIFTLFLFLAVGVAVSAQYSEVLKTDATYTIDGVIDGSEWAADGWVDQALNSDASTTTDASSKFQMLHDDDNLYIAVMVTDATPHNEAEIANTYERDCVEIFTHMSDVDANPDTGAYGVESKQMRWQRSNEGHEPAGVEADAGYEAFVLSDDDGYVLEVILPIAALLNGGAAFNDVDFKFDIQTADNTTGAAGGRTQQMFWNNNSDQQWQDTRTFGPLALSETMVQLESTAQVQKEVGSIYVYNDMLNFNNVEGQVAVYSISGALVKQAVIERNGSMDISDLASGLYIVTSKTLTAKIIK
jgi:hypothetical protein